MAQTLRNLGAFMAMAATSFMHAEEIKTNLKAAAASTIEQHGFSGVVLVAHKGEPILHEAYGFTNTPGQIPNTLDTHFLIGSMTKQFTAAAVFMLCERELIKNIHDPISTYLQDFPHKTITIHQILSHTSGLINLPPLPAQASTDLFVIDKEAIIAQTYQQPLVHNPGETYLYSNAGYIILTKLVEVVSAMDFDKFMQQNLFNAIGTPSAGWETSDDAAITISADEPRKFICTQPLGSGNLRCTANDVCKLLRALYQGNMLQKPTKEIMLTPVKNSYACGVLVEDAQTTMIWHNGKFNGFTSYGIYYPEQDITIVVLANKGTSATIAHALHKIITPAGVAFYTLDAAGNKVAIV
jgi:CubicO group peptidase (beta-lactamase class C family)